MALGVAALIGLVIARSVEPDPRGFGTHEQLGFSPCFFQRWTGYPCPTCGATTAWSHALRGNVGRALMANSGGVISCLAALVGAPWLLLSAVLGRWLIFRPSLRLLLTLAGVWLLVVLCDWLRRLFLAS